MCQEDNYNGQRSYPQDELGYVAEYSSAFDKFIHEHAEKYLSNSEGFKAAISGQSAGKSLAEALAYIAFALTTPTYEWAYTINWYYDYVNPNQNDIPRIQCFPGPEEVGYIHYLDDLGYNKMWMSGSTDEVTSEALAYEERGIQVRQHWCFDDDGINLNVAPEARLNSMDGRRSVFWCIFNTEGVTPVHVSMTSQLEDGSWVHQRDMTIKELNTGSVSNSVMRMGVEGHFVAPHQYQRSMVHSVIKVKVRG